jgi:hypothetical protein
LLSYFMKRLERVLRGEALAPLTERAKAWLADNGGTANMRRLAHAAVLHDPGANPELKALVTSRWARMLEDEEHLGPQPWELLTGDPHGGMHRFAAVGLVAAGLAPGAPAEVRTLALRQLGVEARLMGLYDVVASQDGDVRALPGMRANNPDGPSRLADTAVYRQLSGRPPRGTGGKVAKKGLEGLHASAPSISSYAGAIWWKRLQLQHPDVVGTIMAYRSPPDRLRLGLRVYRLPDGIIAALDDPGPLDRRRYDTHGSEAASRDDDHVENCTSYVHCTFGNPAKHRFEKVILSWQEPEPALPEDARLVLQLSGVD